MSSTSRRSGSPKNSAAAIDVWASAGIDYSWITVTGIWYVQVGALVVGHVAGLAIAHDRAVGLFEDRRAALRSQYPMLALMILYTVGGLWVLSRG